MGSIIKGVAIGLIFIITAVMAFLFYPFILLKDVFIIIHKDGYVEKQFKVVRNAIISIGDETGTKSHITYGVVDGEEERLFEPDKYPLSIDSTISVWVNPNLEAEYALIGNPRVLLNRTGTFDFIYKDVLFHTLIFVSPFFICVALYKFAKKMNDEGNSK